MPANSSWDLIQGLKS